MSGRSLSRWAARALCSLLAAAGGCATPATAVVVFLDTDAPSQRPLRVRAELLAPGRDAGRGEWVRAAGVGGAITLPATFTTVPGSDAPRDLEVTLAIDAELAATASDPVPLRWRRFARYRFTPGRTGALRLFLSTACGAMVNGCRDASAPCTVARRCEDDGLTCGDEGRCVAREVAPTLVTPEQAMSLVDAARTDALDAGGRDVVAMDASEASLPDAMAIDASMDAAIDVAVMDARDASLPDVTAMDARADAAPDACRPNCAGRECGPDGCGGTCGTCAARPNATASCNGTGRCALSCAADFGDCDGLNANGCEATLRDNDAHCGACPTACMAPTRCRALSCVTPPAGDTCSSAPTFSNSAGGTTCGGDSTANACGAGVGTADVFREFIAPASGNYLVQVSAGFSFFTIATPSCSTVIICYGSMASLFFPAGTRTLLGVRSNTANACGVFTLSATPM